MGCGMLIGRWERIVRLCELFLLACSIVAGRRGLGMSLRGSFSWRSFGVWGMH
jgi:hypothetical protein